MHRQGLIFELAEDAGDTRGSSFALPVDLFDEPFHLQDVHVSSMVPGAVRGNHYHLVRREVLLIRFDDAWSFHWDEGLDTAVHVRHVDGSGLAAIDIPVKWSHAVRNDGGTPLILTGLSSHRYRLDDTDAYPRVVV